MFYRTCVFLVLFNYVFQIVKCEEDSPNYFLSAAKNVPRIGRNTKGNSDFEKFFLKASKSVPRIGRRNDNSIQYEDYDKEVIQRNYKYPTWSNLAELYENEPELFSNPAFVAQLDEMLGDDLGAYDWGKERTKRTVPARFAMKQRGFFRM